MSNETKELSISSDDALSLGEGVPVRPEFRDGSAGGKAPSDVAVAHVETDDGVGVGTGAAADASVAPIPIVGAVAGSAVEGASVHPEFHDSSARGKAPSDVAVAPVETDAGTGVGTGADADTSAAPILAPIAGAVAGSAVDIAAGAGGASADEQKTVTTVGLTPEKLDELLHLWANVWVKQPERGARDAIVREFYYEDNEIMARLQRSDTLKGKAKQFPGLALDYQDMEITKEEYLVGHSEWKSSKEEVKNKTSSPIIIKIGSEETVTVQKGITWTKSAEASLGLEASGGVPGIASAKLAISLKGTITKAAQDLDTVARKQSDERTATCQSGRHCIVTKFERDIPMRIHLKATVQLSGGVLVCCDSDVNYAGDRKRTGIHKKWYIRIHEVFHDLQRYVELPNVSESNKETIREALKAYVIQDDKVCFNLLAEKTLIKKERRTECEEVLIEGSAPPKPLAAATAAGVGPAPADTPAPMPVKRGVTHGCAIAEEPGSVAEKEIGDKDAH